MEWRGTERVAIGLAVSSTICSTIRGLHETCHVIDQIAQLPDAIRKIGHSKEFQCGIKLHTKLGKKNPWNREAATTNRYIFDTYQHNDDPADQPRGKNMLQSLWEGVRERLNTRLYKYIPYIVDHLLNHLHHHQELTPQFDCIIFVSHLPTGVKDNFGSSRLNASPVVGLVGESPSYSADFIHFGIRTR